LKLFDAVRLTDNTIDLDPVLRCFLGELAEGIVMRRLAALQRLAQIYDSCRLKVAFAFGRGLLLSFNWIALSKFVDLLRTQEIDTVLFGMMGAREREF
jgi:hypothetical protein